ncbi:MAG: sensor histidine kinase [Bacteroidales bacterium]|nr:sensor histidine kinase [Bacteroidales bacterium]MCM1147086.1 sensor histidine kinase [Bacteroidales bacterium]MCM1205780.1 sensor histidine kinase [Bacillota bacterium]MCM1511173.1 sensor histidine kinase [Clostridium sp.]
MKFSLNSTTVVFDLFFCIVFVPLIIVLGPARYWLIHWTGFFFLTCAYLYICYFTIKYLNFPKLMIAKRYKRIAGAVSLFICSNCLLSHFPLPDVEFITPAMTEYQTSVRDQSIVLSMWLMFSLVVGYSLTVSFVNELYEQLLLKKKIENQKNKAEMEMFKAQISPHFLFNTLNSLYSLVIGTSQKAEDAFIKFTEILKYTYVTIGNESVALKDEVAYIQNYIDLQALRLNRHTTVDWSHDIDNDGIMVPPMILLTFVENAFKYGTSTSRDCSIVIRLALKDGVLCFETRNKVMKHADEFRRDLPVGMENCRTRLEALFPDRHTLETSEKDNDFKVSMKIQLF